MKIKRIRSWSENLSLIRPYKIATRYVSDVSNVFVHVELENGIVGLGAGSPAPGVTGETFENCEHSLLEKNLTWLLGQSIEKYQALCEKLTMTPAANAAVDIALHDAFSKSVNKPLVEVFGRCHDELPTSITIGIKNVSETIEEAEEYVERGFRILKVKLGRSVEEDIERLYKLRERFSDEIIVRVDMNQGYNIDEFNRFIKDTSELDLEFYEQPFHVSDVQELKLLDKVYRDKVALDENLVSVADAQNLKNLCGIYNIKLMKCGGINAARQIAAIALANQIDLMWGCMDESRISIAAALHSAFAAPNTKYIDLDGSLDLAHDIVDGGFILENGVMRTTEAPGLGLMLI